MEVSVRVQCVAPTNNDEDQAEDLFIPFVSERHDQQSITQLRESLANLAEEVNSKLNKLLQAQEMAKPKTKVKQVKHTTSSSDESGDADADD